VNNTPALFAARLTRAWSTRVKHGWPFLASRPLCVIARNAPSPGGRVHGENRVGIFSKEMSRGTCYNKADASRSARTLI